MSGGPVDYQGEPGLFPAMVPQALDLSAIPVVVSARSYSITLEITLVHIVTRPVTGMNPSGLLHDDDRGARLIIVLLWIDNGTLMIGCCSPVLRRPVLSIERTIGQAD